MAVRGDEFSDALLSGVPDGPAPRTKRRGDRVAKTKAKTSQPTKISMATVATGKGRTRAASAAPQASPGDEPSGQAAQSRLSVARALVARTGLLADHAALAATGAAHAMTKDEAMRAACQAVAALAGMAALALQAVLEDELP